MNLGTEEYKQLREIISRWQDYALKAGDEFQRAADIASRYGDSDRQYEAGEHLGHVTGLRRAAQELSELIEQAPPASQGTRPAAAPAQAPRPAQAPAPAPEKERPDDGGGRFTLLEID